MIYNNEKRELNKLMISTSVFNRGFVVLLLLLILQEDVIQVTKKGEIRNERLTILEDYEVRW